MISTTSHPLQAKGLLLKIKDENQITRGYLFGTGHTFKVKFDHLHPKIIKYFNNSELFVEISFRSKEKYMGHLSAMSYTQASIRLQLARSSEYELNSVFENAIQHSREIPKGIDDVLINKAEELGKEINDIDTIENMRILEEQAYFHNHEFYSFMHDICDILIDFNSEKPQDDLIKVYSILLQSLDIIDLKNSTHIKEYKYFLETLEALCAHVGYLGDEINSLKNRYFNLFSIQDEDRKTINDVLNGIRSKTWLNGTGVSESWINGTIEHDMNTHLKLDSTDFDRDPYMAEVIHENLQSHPEKINFFAVGCLHLINNQRNIRKILTDKGWSIISILGHSTVSNMGNLDRVSRFFTINKDK